MWDGPEAEARFDARALDHPGEACRRERRAALRREHERRLLLLFALKPPQCPQLSSPMIGWVLGVPCLTRRTCSVAEVNST
jgi:hypothetical protein